MNNMKIVVLAGLQDTGKTNILNRLIRDLRDDGFNKISGIVREINDKDDGEDGYAFLEKGRNNFSNSLSC